MLVLRRRPAPADLLALLPALLPAEETMNDVELKLKLALHPTSVLTGSPTSGRVVSMNPTQEQFGAYQGAFHYFNEKLFGNRLPGVLLNFSRRAKTYGFFAPERWKSADGTIQTHEISLNPTLMDRGLKDVFSTLVHELCHLDHFENGTKKSKRGYHNMEWVGIMKGVGLQPSTTGQPGGREVGFKVSHYIVEGGKFEQAFNEMPKECLLPWQGTIEMPGAGKQAAKRIKYHCAACDFNVYTVRDGLHLNCGDCNNSLIEGP